MLLMEILITSLAEVDQVKKKIIQKSIFIRRDHYIL